MFWWFWVWFVVGRFYHHFVSVLVVPKAADVGLIRVPLVQLRRRDVCAKDLVGPTGAGPLTGCSDDTPMGVGGQRLLRPVSWSANAWR